MSEELIIILITYDTYDFAITFFSGSNSVVMANERNDFSNNC